MESKLKQTCFQTSGNYIITTTANILTGDIMAGRAHLAPSSPRTDPGGKACLSTFFPST